MKIARITVPEGYEYAEPETCAFGDILYAFPYTEEGKPTPVVMDDAKLLLFPMDPVRIKRVFRQSINPGVDDDCWMTVDIGHPFGYRAIIVGHKTHWLKRKE
jgi:hypothetical protein